MDVHVHEREYFGAADIVDERLQSRMSFATVVSDQADVYKVSRGILEKLLVQNPKLKSYIKNMYKVRQLKEANS